MSEGISALQLRMPQPVKSVEIVKRVFMRPRSSFVVFHPEPFGRSADSFIKPDGRLPAKLRGGLPDIQYDVVHFPGPLGSVSGLDSSNSQSAADRREDLVVGGRIPGGNI